MIRVLLVDDHPAMRRGLSTVLGAEHDIEAVGMAAGEHDLWPALNTTRPDVVVLDYHLAGSDGFQLCHRLKSMILSPKVVIYSAYADSSMALGAHLAGADGLIDKGAPAIELYQAIRSVAAGERMLPPLTRDLIDAAAERLDQRDVAIVGMFVNNGATPADVARALGLEPDDVARRVSAILGRLCVDVPAAR